MIEKIAMQFSSRVLHNYAEGWRRAKSKDARFSDRTLRNFSSVPIEQTFAMVAAKDGAPVEILLYDEIGYYGISAKDFVLALAQAGDGPLTLRINSPGGDVFDGLAIFNALRARTAPVNVVVDGLAASAASFIAMAGTTLTMAEQSMMMIHNAWGIVIGDRNDMLDMASVMEKIDGQLAAIYAAKCGKDAAAIGVMMDDETWFTSNEAKAAGLCDVILTAPKPAAASNAVRLKIENKVETIARNANASLPAYDPDGDGDNDAEEALGMVNAACVLLSNAMMALTGEPDDDDDDANAANGNQPIVPGAQTDVVITDGVAVDLASAAVARVEAMKRRLRLAEMDAA